MVEFATFGQELYLNESMRAIEMFWDACGSDLLSARIAELLPHASQSTRLRIASKIVQRHFRSGTAFPRLARNTATESSRRDLLYWRTARTDGIITAIASEVFYPFFVLNTMPKGYDDESFRMANTATLFSVDRVITRDFAIRYARDAWSFDSARTVALALRIMKQAGILDAIGVRMMNRHVLGYYQQPHPIEPAIFAYCMYEEFLDGSPAVSLDRVHNGDCVKAFLLSRMQVDSILRGMEQKGLIALTTQPGGRHVTLAHSNLDALVDRLILL